MEVLALDETPDEHTAQIKEMNFGLDAFCNIGACNCVTVTLVDKDQNVYGVA